MDSLPAIKISSLKKSFGAVKALRDVDISVQRGEIFGFLGPNGAGKTTTIRCLMDYMRPDSGQIEIMGMDSIEQAPAIKKAVGYLSADNQLYDHWNGKQHIKFVLGMHGLPYKSHPLVKKLDLDINKRVKDLSSGNKQKLSIILAFCTEPEILIMDEPSRGLDPLLQIELYQLLKDYKKAGKTVFFSSHNLPEVERVCDRVAVIKDGVVAKTAKMEDLLQLRTHIIRVTSEKPIQRNELKGLKAEIETISDHHVILRVKGRLEPALKLLENIGIKDLEISHASLEEIFMEYYGK